MCIKRVLCLITAFAVVRRRGVGTFPRVSLETTENHDQSLLEIEKRALES